MDAARADAGYDLRITVDAPCRISMRDHGSGPYRAVTDGPARDATVRVEFGRSYDFRAAGPQDLFHDWVGSREEYSTNTPASALSLKTERVLAWPRVLGALGLVAMVSLAVAVRASRRMRSVQAALEGARVQLTEAEARGGLFPTDGSLPGRIGPYDVVRRLGTGGMAVVYHVRNASGEDLALKLPLPTLLDDAEFRTRFAREMKLGMRLHHPNLVLIVDVNTGDEGPVQYPYMVMELVRGEPLEDRLRREGALPVDDALSLARQMLDALIHVHGRGIVHRDVKPSNVMLTARGRAKLMDFGVAHRQETSGARLTATDEILGTPLYMAPEQIQGGTADVRADLYSVGMVLYEMLAGSLPFTATDPYQVVFQKLSQDLPPLRLARADVTVSTEACVARLLARDPGERFQTAAAARDAVERCRA